MDNLRGHHPDTAEGFGAFDVDPIEDEPVRELPPAIIGQDERRMQVRAYNLWASMLENRNFPPVDALSPGDLPDFGPWSVLLDFTSMPITEPSKNSATISTSTPSRSR